ncbi:hypothetical protein KOW79_014474 [Hemibagrus wyckioides]|uniref:Uncharacterized protein n=1 Tax=Hemibagrus wyckioides TaxID=337641 RepID=A0A9D3NF90_9TELE|nr:hypothetical protein KOW79_014474 [Hemibagrus wyckioides]
MALCFTGVSIKTDQWPVKRNPWMFRNKKRTETKQLGVSMRPRSSSRLLTTVHFVRRDRHRKATGNVSFECCPKEKTPAVQTPPSEDGVQIVEAVAEDTTVRTAASESSVQIVEAAASTTETAA